MSKLRKFSIVVHNVRPGEKPRFESYFKAHNPKWLLVAEEEYPEHPDAPDRHIHVFVEYHNPKSFKKMLKEMELLSKHSVYLPQQREGMWGRVQIDQGHGSKQECDDYLAGLTKDKPTDNDVTSFEAPPPGHYTCYSCNKHYHGINMMISHMSMTGVCTRCYHIHLDMYPGEWQYVPEMEKSIYVFSDLKNPRPPTNFFSQGIVPPQNAVL